MFECACLISNSLKWSWSKSMFVPCSASGISVVPFSTFYRISFKYLDPSAVNARQLNLSAFPLSPGIKRITTKVQWIEYLRNKHILFSYFEAQLNYFERFSFIKLVNDIAPLTDRPLTQFWSRFGHDSCRMT